MDTAALAISADVWYDIGKFAVGTFFGAVAMLATVTGMRRRPKIRAKWETDYSDPNYGPVEGLRIDVILGKRPLEVDELGLLILWGRRSGLGRRRSQHYIRGRPSRPLPARMEDGERVSTGFHVDMLIDELHEAIGDERFSSSDRAYVVASGKEYRARTGSEESLATIRTKLRRLSSVVKRA